MHPFTLTKLGEDDIVSVTPYRDQNGRRIIIYKFGNWRPSKIPVDDIFKASLILLEMGAMEPQSQVLGGVGEFLKLLFFNCCYQNPRKKKVHVFLFQIFPGIFDLEGLSLQHIWNLSPSVAKKIISLMVVIIFSAFIQFLHSIIC